MSLDAVTDKLLPDENDPVSMRRWRLRIAAVACSNWLFTFLLLVPALTVGLPLVGQLAWAKDQEHRVVAVEQKLDTILKLSLEERMREVRDELCVATNKATVRVLEQAMSDLQTDYTVLTGDPYFVGRCKVQ